MSDLKPIQPTSYDLLARTVQQLATLNAQQEQQARALADLTAAVKSLHGIRYTKIIDLNVPFWNLAGFIVKLALASVPAYVVLAFLVFMVTALLGTSCTALSLLGQ